MARPFRTRRIQIVAGVLSTALVAPFISPVHLAPVASAVEATAFNARYNTTNFWDANEAVVQGLVLEPGDSVAATTNTIFNWRFRTSSCNLMLVRPESKAAFKSGNQDIPVKVTKADGSSYTTTLRVNVVDSQTTGNSFTEPANQCPTPTPTSEPTSTPASSEPSAAETTSPSMSSTTASDFNGRYTTANFWNKQEAEVEGLRLQPGDGVSPTTNTIFNWTFRNDNGTLTVIRPQSATAFRSGDVDIPVKVTTADGGSFRTTLRLNVVDSRPVADWESQLDTRYPIDFEKSTAARSIEGISLPDGVTATKASITVPAGWAVSTEGNTLRVTPPSTFKDGDVDLPIKVVDGENSFAATLKIAAKNPSQTPSEAAGTAADILGPIIGGIIGAGTGGGALGGLGNIIGGLLGGGSGSGSGSAGSGSGSGSGKGLLEGIVKVDVHPSAVVITGNANPTVVVTGNGSNNSAVVTGNANPVITGNANPTVVVTGNGSNNGSSNSAVVTGNANPTVVITGNLNPTNNGNNNGNNNGSSNSAVVTGNANPTVVITGNLNPSNNGNNNGSNNSAVVTGNANPVITGNANPVITGNLNNNGNPTNNGNNNGSNNSAVVTGNANPVITGNANPVITGNLNNNGNPVITGNANDNGNDNGSNNSAVVTGNANPTVVITGNLNPSNNGNNNGSNNSAVVTGNANPVVTNNANNNGSNNSVVATDNAKATVIVTGNLNPSNNGNNNGSNNSVVATDNAKATVIVTGNANPVITGNANDNGNNNGSNNSAAVTDNANGGLFGRKKQGSQGSGSEEPSAQGKGGSSLFDANVEVAGGSSDPRCIAPLVGLGLPLIALVPIAAAQQLRIPGLEQLAAQASRAFDDTARQFSIEPAQLTAVGGGAVGVVATLLLVAALRTCVPEVRGVDITLGGSSKETVTTTVAPVVETKPA